MFDIEIVFCTLLSPTRRAAALSAFPSSRFSSSPSVGFPAPLFSPTHQATKKTRPTFDHWRIGRILFQLSLLRSMRSSLFHTRPLSYSVGCTSLHVLLYTRMPSYAIGVCPHFPFPLSLCFDTPFHRNQTNDPRVFLSNSTRESRRKSKIRSPPIQGLVYLHRLRGCPLVPFPIPLRLH